MKNPINPFKERLKEGKPLLGIWNTIGGNTVPEMLAGAGYDWILVDCEHAAIETVEVLPALQAIAAYPETAPVVRPASNDPVLFKRILDMGAQSIMVPFVQTREDAEKAVAATRYGPIGMRGMSGMTRATRYGKVEDYFNSAHEEICLIVQVETVEALGNLEEIASVDGVDAVFIGPSDLSASMGLAGQTNHPTVREAIMDAFQRLDTIAMPKGLMALDVNVAKGWIEAGSQFTAIGVDLVMLAQIAQQLRSEF